MKFMKLGSKPDCFQSAGNNIRYVATDLATDVTVIVGDVKFNLHKFPLLSKSVRLRRLVAAAKNGNSAEMDISNIPGGPASFEICAKFCYGMTVTLNPYNVATVRCASEYLEMYETLEKGNLIYKIEVFLNSSIFRTWKDSIIVLQSTNSLLPWCEDLKVISRCIDCISFKASIDTSKVDWSYTYNHAKFSSEDGIEPQWTNIRKQQSVPRDWWIEDINELQLDHYKRVIMSIKSKGIISDAVIGESLNAYVTRKLSGLSKSAIQNRDIVKFQTLVETATQLLPSEPGAAACSLMLKLLKATCLLDCEETGKSKLIKRVGQQLHEASVSDLLIPSSLEGNMLYNVDVIINILEEFLTLNQNVQTLDSEIVTRQDRDKSEIIVAKLIDGYLARIAGDPSLPLSVFINLAEMLPNCSRPSHDSLYRAIDMYLKEHPGLSKSERKKLCRLMDCGKLSVDACTHAVQNDRLPLRIIVQILFFHQMKYLPSLYGHDQALNILEERRSEDSKMAIGNSEDWVTGNNLQADIRSPKGDTAFIKMEGVCGVEQRNSCSRRNNNKNQVKGSHKVFNKLWSSKDHGDNRSSSHTSESPATSINPEESKSTPSSTGRYSAT